MDILIDTKLKHRYRIETHIRTRFRILETEKWLISWKTQREGFSSHNFLSWRAKKKRWAFRYFEPGLSNLLLKNCDKKQVSLPPPLMGDIKQSWDRQATIETQCEQAIKATNTTLKHNANTTAFGDVRSTWIHMHRTVSGAIIFGVVFCRLFVSVFSQGRGCCHNYKGCRFK